MIERIKLTRAKDIQTYAPSAALNETVKMAIALGRPLLLAGKPGTGKTQFAHWFVYENENDYNEVFQFNTKSTSLFNDLFYQYDAVSHFRDKSGTRDVSEYITLTALGKAIVCAKGLATITDERLLRIAQHSGLHANNKSKSMVLIDEIDKAPRDFPNDLLHEIENLSFSIKETIPAIEVKLNDKEKENIIIVLTSNDEKNLPDAFLRRCLFHYIEFPDRNQLAKIILTKLNDDAMDGLEDKLNFFDSVCSLPNNIEKKPSTSEWIDWINFLKNNQLLGITIHNKDQNELSGLERTKIIQTLSILFKKKEDTEHAIKLLAPEKSNL